MKAALILGNTCSLNAEQCGQVIEAYSVIVTAASAGPSAMSGNETGLATSGALWAKASATSRSGDNPDSAASPVNETSAVKARRVMIKVGSRIDAFDPFASLKWLLRQWRAAIRRDSISLDRGAKPRQRRSQVVVLDGRQAFGDFCHRFRIRRRGHRAIASRQRGLAQRQPADGAPAEEAVDALQDHVRTMLDFQRHRSLDAQHQRCRL